MIIIIPSINVFVFYLGDVVLRDLKLKETCLDSLDLPVRTIYGHLGKLNIKFGFFMNVFNNNFFFIVQANWF